MRTLATFAAVAVTAISPAVAQAERAVGITGNTRLVSFDTLTPGTASVKTITGFASADEHVIGLDVRPATGELMAVTAPAGSATSATIRTYQLDPNSAVVTLVGSVNGTISGAGDRASGIDFNPLADRLRVVQSNNENFRISPSSGGQAGDDDNLTYTAPATGPVTGIAYDRNVAPGPPGTPPSPDARTTAYGIDTGSSRLVLVGGADGTPSPNLGQVTAVGQLGITLVNGSDAGFDISPTGAAFATLTTAAGIGNLYSINLGTGQATDLGPLPAVVGSLAILPGNTPAGGGGTAADTDGDGKPDSSDACPTVAAATADGCPAAAPATPTTTNSPGDTTAPGVTVSGLAKQLKLAKFLKGVTLKVKPNEAASFVIELVATARSAKLAKAGELVLASSSLKSAAGERAVKLKPSRKLVGKAKKFTVTVRVTATDASGNRRVVSRKVAVAR
jgi:hypothetical protein